MKGGKGKGKGKEWLVERDEREERGGMVAERGSASK